MFHLRSPDGKYKMNFSEADAACKNEGATLATFEQLGDAQQVKQSEGVSSKDIRLVSSWYLQGLQFFVVLKSCFFIKDSKELGVGAWEWSRSVSRSECTL